MSKTEDQESAVDYEEGEISDDGEDETAVAPESAANVGEMPATQPAQADLETATSVAHGIASPGSQAASTAKGFDDTEKRRHHKSSKRKKKQHRRRHSSNDSEADRPAYDGHQVVPT
ncbi:hypothetical protein BOX15_Mlig006595g1, partial [Macrostomum lignano]